MRVCGYLIFVALFFTSYDVAASCVRSAPRVIFDTEIRPVEYVRDIPLADLRALHRTAESAVGYSGGSVVASLRAEFEMSPAHGDLVCLNVNTVHVDFYPIPTIYIAQNYKRGSCEYNALLKHEQLHVDALRRVFRDHVASYKSDLLSAVFRHVHTDPVPLRDMNAQKEYILHNIQHDVSAPYEEMLGILNATQEGIDTPEEYARLRRSCSRWESKVRR